MASTPPPVSGNTANITVTLAANGVAVFDTAIANISLSNLVVQTENVTTLNVSTNLFAANATVNGVSFIPVWTNATMNSSYIGVVGGGWFNIGYWVDPFGICHVRGLLEANVNVSIAGSQSVNIANGFPKPAGANQVSWGATGANNTGASQTFGTYRMQIYGNGAMQIAGGTFASGNLNYILLDGFHYSTLS